MAGAQVILGGDGADALAGGDGPDTLDGGDGNDSLDGGDGNDLLDGGVGADRLQDFSPGPDTLRGGPGNDAIYAGIGSDSLDGGEGNDNLSVYAPAGGIHTVVGGAGDDTVFGSEGADMIDGGDGDDSIVGFGGEDTLAGGGGNNILIGGFHNDTYVIGSRATTVVDSGGVDTAIVTASFVKLPASIESVSYAAGAIALPYWIDALLPTEAAGMRYAQLLGPAKVYRYSFPQATPAYAIAETADFEPFNVLQRAGAVQALELLETLLDLDFVPAADAQAPNTLAFYNRGLNATGAAEYPSTALTGSDVWFSTASEAALRPLAGTEGAFAMVHEIGHALGLEHPGRYLAGGIPTTPPDLGPAEDRSAWTVMSYVNSPQQFQIAYSPLDIAALQYLYGPSRTARSGDDVYTVTGGTAQFVWDGGGIDTLDASALAQPVTLALEPGHWSFVGSQASNITADGQLTVNFGSVIERLLGGSGDDLLAGNGADNTIDGGDGVDTIAYAGPRAGYALSGSVASLTVSDMTAARDGTDLLTRAEVLHFSDRSVHLGIAALAQSIPQAQLQTLLELYVGFFGRIPEARGLGWWIAELAAGAGLQDIAQRFHEAGVQFGVFPAGMDDAAFVGAIYGHVLARPPGSAQAPSAQEIGYWTALLQSGQHSRGSMVLQMLHDVHAGFEGHPTLGFVADLLDNRAAVARWYAIEQGLALHEPAADIAFGIQMAAAVTPTDTAAAIALVGLQDGFSLL